MYANLRVEPLPDAKLRPGAIGPDAISGPAFARVEAQVEREGAMYAHEVVVMADGHLRVALDSNDGESNYAEHAGYVTIHGGARIVADF